MKRAGAIAVVVAVCAALLWQCTDTFGETEDVDTITVFGPWLGGDADAFAASVDGFSGGRGSEVRYTGSLNFQDVLRERVAAVVDAPDIAVVPQPGLIRDLVANARLVPFSDEIVDVLEDNYPPGTWDEFGGRVYSVPYRSIVKSLVWYRPEVFATNGWEVPSTLDELGLLVDDIAQADGIDPWCFGIFSGDDTGWPATDWVEDLLLRRAGPDVYDEWVEGDRGFADPAVRAAFDEFRELVLEPGRTSGGTGRVLGTSLAAIDDPLFATAPGCAMYKQASFGTIWFPDGTEIGVDGDVDFFVLPGETADEPAPLVVSGDRIVQLSDRPEVGALVTYLASPAGAREWAARGGFLSSRTNVDVDEYYQPQDRRLAEVLQEPSERRFDGSDQFTSVARDAFLEQITAWIAGAIDYTTLADTLDALRAG